MEGQAAEHHDAHEQGDFGHVQSNLDRENDAHGIEGTDHQTCDASADHADRRRGVEGHDVKRAAIAEIGFIQTRHRDRDQRKHDQRGSQHEEIGSTDVSEVDQHLPRRDGKVEGQHIRTEDAPACFVAAFGVQPAFDRGSHAGNAEAVDKPEDQPCCRMEKGYISQCDCSRQRRENSESTDMSDPKDDAFAVQTPERQAEVVGRHDRPGQRHRIARCLHAKRQNDTEQTVADHEACSATQKGFYRGKDLAHAFCHWQDSNPVAEDMQRTVAC